MSVLEKAVSHFSSKEIRTLEVPEWECTLYSKNLTLEDKAKWVARSDGDSTLYLVYAVIFGVTDKNGEPVFTIGDKTKLMKAVDPEVLSKVANFVLVNQDPEELEKN